MVDSIEIEVIPNPTGEVTGTDVTSPGGSDGSATAIGASGHSSIFI